VAIQSCLGFFIHSYQLPPNEPEFFQCTQYHHLINNNSYGMMQQGGGIITTGMMLDGLMQGGMMHHQHGMVHHQHHHHGTIHHHSGMHHGGGIMHSGGIVSMGNAALAMGLLEGAMMGSAVYGIANGIGGYGDGSQMLAGNMGMVEDTMRHNIGDINSGMQLDFMGNQLGGFEGNMMNMIGDTDKAIGGLDINLGTFGL